MRNIICAMWVCSGVVACAVPDQDVECRPHAERTCGTPVKAVFWTP